MSEKEVLDLKALRKRADGRPEIERQILLGYFDVANQCLKQMCGLVVEYNAEKWRSVANALRDASANIHAEQLTALCESSVALYNPESAASRMYVYTQIADAYNAVWDRIGANYLLTPKEEGY